MALVEMKSLPAETPKEFSRRVKHKRSTSDDHKRDVKYSDPDGIRSATRPGMDLIEYYGVATELEFISEGLRRSPSPDGCKKYLRKNVGYSGVVNPCLEEQSIIQALPDSYFVREQLALYQDVKNYIEKHLPGVDFLVALHPDKDKLHSEFMVFKYGRDRHLVPSCAGIRFDGTGLTGIRGKRTAKGIKLDDSKFKWNSLMAVSISFRMRERFQIYEKELGRDAWKQLKDDSKIIFKRLDDNISNYSKKRRKRQELIQSGKLKINYSRPNVKASLEDALGSLRGCSSEELKQFFQREKLNFEPVDVEGIDWSAFMSWLAQHELDPIQRIRRKPLDEHKHDLLRAHVRENSPSVEPALEPIIGDFKQARSKVEVSLDEALGSLRGLPAKQIKDFFQRGKSNSEAIDVESVDWPAFKIWLAQYEADLIRGKRSKSFDEQLHDLLRSHIRDDLPALDPILEPKKDDLEQDV
jgi:hypothetical protein